LSKWLKKQLSHFKFNAYIRYYMLAYYDLTFFSAMKLAEGNDSTQLRKIASVASIVLLILSVVVPFTLITIMCKRF